MQCKKKKSKKIKTDFCIFCFSQKNMFRTGLSEDLNKTESAPIKNKLQV